MTQQSINIGSSANDGTGTTHRAAFDICNDNFDELYDKTLKTDEFSVDGTPSSAGGLYVDADGKVTRSFPVVSPSIKWNFARDHSLSAEAGPVVSLSRSTTGTFMGADGVIRTAAINEPRFQHKYMDGNIVPRGLLLEPSRRNLFLVSRLFSNGNWIKNNVTLTSGQADLRGGTDAFLVTDTDDGATVTTHRLYQAANVTNATTYCASIFAKPGTIKKLLVQGTGPLFFYVQFDLERGTFEQFDETSMGVGGMEQYPNGWWRCWVVKTATSSALTNVQYWPLGDGFEGYVGDGTGTMTIDMAQLEDGDAPSTPIDTVSPTITRGADVCAVSGAAVTSAYSASSTLSLEVDAEHATTTAIAKLSDGTADNEVAISLAAKSPVASIITGGASQMSETAATKVVTGQLNKVALAWAANDVALAAHGIVGSADTSASIPASLDTLDLAAMNGCIGSLTLSPGRQSAIELVAKTRPAPKTAELHNIIIDGNSLSTGFGASTCDSYPAQMMALLGNDYRHVDISLIAVGGQRTAQMNTDRVSQVNPLITSGRTLILAWEITNELVDARAPRAAVDELWIYTDAVRVLGAKVIVATVLPRTEGGSIPAGFNANRATVNSLLLQEWQDHADGLADVAAQPAIGPTAASTDTTYYTDGTHMTQQGYAIVANSFAKAIQTLVANW